MVHQRRFAFRGKRLLDERRITVVDVCQQSELATFALGAEQCVQDDPIQTRLSDHDVPSGYRSKYSGKAEKTMTYITPLTGRTRKLSFQIMTMALIGIATVFLESST